MGRRGQAGQVRHLQGEGQVSVAGVVLGVVGRLHCAAGGAGARAARAGAL